MPSMALRQGSHATWPGGGRGGRSCRRCSRLLARAVVPPGGRRGAARQVPRRRGSLPGTGSPVTGRLARREGLARPAWDCPLPARSASGRFPGAQDCQRKWQTVYPGSRTFLGSRSRPRPATERGAAPRRCASVPGTRRDDGPSRCQRRAGRRYRTATCQRPSSARRISSDFSARSASDSKDADNGRSASAANHV